MKFHDYFRTGSVIAISLLVFVAMINGCSDNSTGSNDDSNTPPASGPTDVLAVVPDNSHTELSWTDTSSVVEAFVIERKNGSEEFDSLAQVPAGIFEHTYNGPSQVGSIWRIRARHVGGFSWISDEVVSQLGLSRASLPASGDYTYVMTGSGTGWPSYSDTGVVDWESRGEWVERNLVVDSMIVLRTPLTKGQTWQTPTSWEGLEELGLRGLYPFTGSGYVLATVTVDTVTLQLPYGQVFAYQVHLVGSDEAIGGETEHDITAYYAASLGLVKSSAHHVAHNPYMPTTANSSLELVNYSP